MPTPMFFRLPAERRDRLVREALTEFADRPYAEASLSQIAVRSKIPKGSFYQYFEDKLDLYRWLLTDEAPRLKRAYLAAGPGPAATADFWARLEHHIERGMAFLVDHPRLARLTAAAADPAGDPDVRGLHKAVCDAGLDELRDLLLAGRESGALPGHPIGIDTAARFVGSVIGPGLTDVILGELDADLHQVLSSPTLRRRLDTRRRARLARQAVAFIRGGLATPTQRSSR